MGSRRLIQRGNSVNMPRTTSILYSVPYPLFAHWKSVSCPWSADLRFCCGQTLERMRVVRWWSKTCPRSRRLCWETVMLLCRRLSDGGLLGTVVFWHVYVNVCICIYMCVCVCVCVYIYIYTHRLWCCCVDGWATRDCWGLCFFFWHVYVCVYIYI